MCDMQWRFDPDPNYLQTRFKQSLSAKGSAFSLTPSTSDAYVYQDEFVNWVKTTYAYSQTDPNRPIWFALDNEPDLWSSTHAEVHPNAATYAEMVQKSTAYATAIKNVMPSTLVFGPVNYGFNGYVNLQNAPDANGRDFLNYYLQQMKQAEQTAGNRLLDVLDVHWYPEARAEMCASPKLLPIRRNCRCSLLPAFRPHDRCGIRLTLKQVGSRIVSGGPIYLLPRLQSKIDANYAGTKLAITEYNYGGGDHISGGIAEADVLGIFGREGVFAANEWALSNNEQFIGGAFRMFRNFNGNNGTFGDTSVFAQTNDNEKAPFTPASIRRIRTVWFWWPSIRPINRFAQMNMQHAQSFALADIYQLTSSSSTPQYADSVLIADPANFNYSMPAYSVSTIEIRPGSGLKRNLVWNQAGGSGILPPLAIGPGLPKGITPSSSPAIKRPSATPAWEMW